MSTVTDNTSTTINKKTDNKALFGPLGNYAIAGVIMVSIIVTAAIMLNKKLGNAAEHVATIEKEVAASIAAEQYANQTAAETTTSIETASAIDTESAIDSEKNEVQNTIETATVAIAAVTTEIAAIVHTSEAPVAEAKAPAAIETADPVITAEETASDTGQNPVQLATIKSATTEPVNISPIQAPMPQLAAYNNDQQWEARIQARKLEQKQHMTEFFERIKSHDSESLEKYKTHQDERVEYLRERIVRQQELIEKLILRNKESYQTREASMQRYQTYREQMLNRI